MNRKQKKSKISMNKDRVIRYRNSSGFNSPSHNYQNINFKGTSHDIFDKSSSNSNSNSNINSNSIYNNNLEMQSQNLELFPYIFVSDPVLELKKANNVIIKNTYDECCCVNQSNNIYSVFIKGNKNSEITYLFRVVELMVCTDYSCCDYFEEPFCLNINHVLGSGTEFKIKSFATAKQAFAIPFCCLCRPKLVIKLCDTKNEIGKIEFPYSWGNTLYNIYNNSNLLKYTINTMYCQPGILCPKNCLGYMPSVTFNIRDENHNIVGTIERKPGQFKEFMHVLDCYQVYFPKSSTIEDKILIICATFMIENRIFKNKSGELENCEGCYCDKYCCRDCAHYCLEGCLSGICRCGC